MKITAPEEYGLRCLLLLARTTNPYGLNIRQVAEAERLSMPYAAKMLRQLRLAGFIRCEPRGHNAGYLLTRPAAEIRLGDVLRALSEPLFEDPGFCERHAHATSDINGPCVRNSDCTLRVIWQTLEHGIRRILDGITLADLLQSPGHISQRLHAHFQAEPPGPPGELLTLGPAIRG